MVVSSESARFFQRSMVRVTMCNIQAGQNALSHACTSEQSVEHLVFGACRPDAERGSSCGIAGMTAWSCQVEKLYKPCKSRIETTSLLPNPTKSIH